MSHLKKLWWIVLTISGTGAAIETAIVWYSGADPQWYIWGMAIWGFLRVTMDAIEELFPSLKEKPR